jgi:hypothetical protein
MNDIKAKVVRSDEYLRLIEELKRSMTSAIDIANKIYEQGRNDGLPNEIMREDIEIALEARWHRPENIPRGGG